MGQLLSRAPALTVAAQRDNPAVEPTAGLRPELS